MITKEEILELFKKEGCQLKRSGPTTKTMDWGDNYRYELELWKGEPVAYTGWSPPGNLMISLYSTVDKRLAASCAGVDLGMFGVKKSIATVEEQRKLQRYLAAFYLIEKYEGHIPPANQKFDVKLGRAIVFTLREDGYVNTLLKEAVALIPQYYTCVAKWKNSAHTPYSLMEMYISNMSVEKKTEEIMTV